MLSPFSVLKLVLLMLFAMFFQLDRAIGQIRLDEEPCLLYTSDAADE